jgi:hypothetical protein
LAADTASCGHLSEGDTHLDAFAEDVFRGNTTSGYAFAALFWMATWGGLVRFDEIQFMVFDPTNTDGMTTSWIDNVFVDHSGALWICPDRTMGESRLMRYRNGRFTTFTAAEGLPNNHVVSITDDMEGGLWLRIKPGPRNTSTETISRNHR